MTRSEHPLPKGVLIAWYGDDFTGAAATMEVLAFAGLQSMLFLETPTPGQLQRFPSLRAAGVASTARTQSPEWMNDELPQEFERLSRLKPAILHYKVCSTLDSSPDVGSIGRAIEIGADLLCPAIVPVLVAAPQMRRYQSFGHLFAGHGEQVYRLDRHPVMSRHPVTPMTESDVARHITGQSSRIDTSLISLEALTKGDAQIAMPPAAKKGRIAVASLDCMDDVSEAAAGRFLWRHRKRNPFVVGSQGVEYALIRHWRNSGLVPDVSPPSGIGRANGMVTVSGSVSPTTAAQIAWSRQNGFAIVPFDGTAACRGSDTLSREENRVAKAALTAIADGRDPLISTAEGPDDPAVLQFTEAISERALDPKTVNQSLGEALGRVLRRILEQSGVRRAVVSGGDTSGHATRQLGIYALSALAPTIPGASISLAHADGPMDGLELALKGGQMGTPDYFGWVRDGGGAR